MLVWLASYPRSGNTLLRQVLKSCFDLSSCEGLEPVPEHFLAPDGIRDEFYGSYFVEGDPEAFYTRAHTAPELVLIKSHQLPRDDAKAIYVVRDGRLAMRSYTKYQDTYHPGTSTFDSLLLGDHPYGEWTSHHRAWQARGGETLVVRFEELVTADAALLARIAGFLDLPGPGRAWVNPQATLREKDAVFFGTGNPEWRPDAFWTPSRLRAFYTLHGPLLAELGYVTADEVAVGAYPAGSDDGTRVRDAHALASRNRELQAVCDARATEIARLKQACDDRATAIDLLTLECDARLRATEEANRERTRLSTQLAAELESRLAMPPPRPSFAARLRRLVRG